MNRSYEVKQVEFWTNVTIAVGTPRQLYRQAWHLRRLMFSNARNISLYRAYAEIYWRLRDSSPLASRMVEQIQSVEYRVLGIAADNAS